MSKEKPVAKKPTVPVETKPENPATAPKAVGVAELKPTKGNKASGSVTLTAVDGKVSVVAEISGLAPGQHGFHIHEKGDCSSPDGKSAGGHFNPAKTDHGGPTAAAHHAGDLGNLVADDKGVAKATMTIDFVTIGTGAVNDAIGKAFIVHEKMDDMKTQPTGAAGARVACGVIAEAKN